MKMEVEIISTEFIKPSSPTPHHLRNYKLSLLDMYTPPFFIPVFFYYPMNQDACSSSSNNIIDDIVSIRLQLLKQSLPETLSLFYPFAGRVKDLHSIDCNDEGLYFVEARVKSTSLNEFLSHPDTSLIDEFLPDDAKWIAEPTPGNYVASVQVTTFACGGMVVGVFVSHMIVDGTAFSTFLKTWSARSLNSTKEEMHPKFTGPSLFPPNDGYPRKVCTSFVLTSYSKFGKFIMRRIVFDGPAIANLKAKATSSGVKNPTRFEVATAVLGKCIMAILKARFGSDKPILFGHAVNLRRKAIPPFSEYDMGNFVWMAATLHKDEEAELHRLVCELRESRRNLNDDFVKSIQGDEGLQNYVEAVKYEAETYSIAADKITFSSWCNFGFYDIDFGWGKPCWVSTCGFAQEMNCCNGVIFMDTRLGDGIEAWVCMREEDIAVLELDNELLAYATVNSSA